MSLHAQPSPEASARLLAERRRSTVSSFLISLLSVVLLLLVLGFVLIQPYLPDRDEAAVSVSRPVDVPPDDPTNPKVSTLVRHTPAAPSAMRQKVLEAETRSEFAIPPQEVEAPAAVPGFGTGDDFGEGWGKQDPGLPGGDKPWSFPPGLGKRCSPQDRLQRLQENGGVPRCEEAVVKGLDWLKATQAADGSWGNNDRAAMTGLALLAFLGHCETPQSEKYGETVLKGITCLVDLGLKTKGKLSTSPGAKHWPYEHAIATYALAEAATFCRQEGSRIPDLYEVTQQAGQFIIDNQHKSGGWDYAYDEAGPRGGDLSITAWQVQALKACEHAGFDFRNLRSCVNRALTFVEGKQDASGGFGYVGKGPAGDTGGYHTLTGAGMLCFQIWDKDSVSSVRNGAKYILKNSRFEYNGACCDLYGHYYEAQAMLRRGGAEWQQYNDMFRDQVLDNQNPDGSWKAPGGGQKVRAVAPQFVADTHYRTCLCILMLETYYRFLPGTGEAGR